MNEYEEAIARTRSKNEVLEELEAIKERRIIVQGICEEIEYHKQRIKILNELLQHSIIVLNKRG